MKIAPSVKLAAIIVVIISAYFMARGLFAPSVAAIEDAPQEKFTVVAKTVSPQEWRDSVVVRGRTEAKRKVVVRAETTGAVIGAPGVEGAHIRKGDPLCLIQVDARKAQRAEARAALAKARLDYDAAEKLNQGGFRSATAVAAAKAALDLAAANVERAEVEFSKTRIVAPFDGIFERRNAEIGDFLRVGDPCGVVIQQTPYLISGAVSEKEIAKITKGDRGIARLASGETVEGAVSFVAAAASPATRTFDVELEVSNEGGAIRDGVTAEFTVFAKKRNAHRIARSSLTLNDDGAIGVQTLTPENSVQFLPVRLLGESVDGVWVSGLTGDVSLIIRGQDYVRAGQVVDVVDADDLNAGAKS